MNFQITKQFKVDVLTGKFNLSKVSPKFWTLTSIRKNGRKLETQKIEFKISKDKDDDFLSFYYSLKFDSFSLKYKAIPTKMKNPKHDISHFLIRYKDKIFSKGILTDDERLADFITIEWQYPFIRID